MPLCNILLFIEYLFTIPVAAAITIILGIVDIAEGTCTNILFIFHEISFNKTLIIVIKLYI